MIFGKPSETAGRKVMSLRFFTMVVKPQIVKSFSICGFFICLIFLIINNECEGEIIYEKD